MKKNEKGLSAALKRKHCQQVSTPCYDKKGREVSPYTPYKT